MSFFQKAQIPTAPPKTAGLDGSDFATNQSAVPVPWHIGPRPAPLTWVVDKVYNQRSVEIRTKAGKGKSTVSGYEYYGDVAGIAGFGLGAKIRGIEVDNVMVWTGAAVRNDTPGHPDYWRKQIVTDAGDVYFYWGRPDQPVDDVLLAGIGAADATLAHPAYRHQCLVVLRNFRLQDSGTVPNVRVIYDRAPSPELGTFAPQNAAGGESIVAGILELATNPLFGAGFPVAHFTAAEWEALSAAVIARVGCHAPYLDRAQPLRDVARDLMLYYDGWCRIEGGKLRPGFFPHDGSVPGGLTELSVHDFTERPRADAGTPSDTVNDVVVHWRDGSDLFKEKPAHGSDSANVEARRAHEPRVVKMPGIITFAQAQAFADEAAATGAEGEWAGELRVRRPRAVWSNGTPLRAGDNFSLDLIEPQVDQVCRITKRTDYFDGQVRLEVKAEPGVYPASYVPPGDLRPDIGAVLPLEIAQARVLELTPDLAGTPLGLPVALLAKRPKSEFEGAALTGANVLGFNVWYGGATGASYDLLGAMPGWAVRGVVREAIASGTADLTVKLTLDADNLDLGRLAAQSAAGQANDNLLVVIGNELFSVGAINLAGLDYDLSCKRVRLGSLPAAHALNAEAWLVWRDELRVFLQADFIEDQDRYFKLQPYTQTAALELADADPLLYHFRDRAPELPVIVLDALPGAPVAGVAYNVSGQISDVNGDLVSFQVQAARLVGTGGAVDSEITLQSGEVQPAEKALKLFKAPLMFPIPGYWVILVRAYDETAGFKELKSAEMNVANGTGGYGSDDGVVPAGVSGVTITSGIEELIIRWTPSNNTPLLTTRIYESATGVQPPLWVATVDAVKGATTAFYFRRGLTEGDARNYWLVEVGLNGRLSVVSGPHAGTVVVWPRISDIEGGLADEEAARILADSNEANLRAAADNDLAGDISTEATIRQNADNSLSANLTTEVSARESGDAANAAAVTAEATARAGADGSLAAEYVLQVVTGGASGRRVAGFRVTNYGGAGGGTDFILQADKVGIVNASGDNQRAPFVVVGGVVCIDTTLIRNATILSAMIDTVVAEKITAGTLTAMKLAAAKTASDSVVFNAAYGDGSTMPTVCLLTDDASPGAETAGTKYYSLFSAHGWGAAPGGFADDRFAKSATVFDGSFHSSVSLPGTTDYADTYGVYRINGGSWNRMAPGSRNNYYSGGGAFTGGQVKLTGLGSTDVVEFGVEVVLPADRTVQYVMAKVIWANL